MGWCQTQASSNNHDALVLHLPQATLHYRCPFSVILRLYKDKLKGGALLSINFLGAKDVVFM